MTWRTYVKDPDATLDYTWDWAPLLYTGDAIATHTITATGLTVGTHTNTATTVTARLSGGSDGSDYMATARITTTGGRIDDRTYLIKIREQ